MLRHGSTITSEERQIRVAAVADYLKFMNLDASAVDIISVIETERMSPGVNWRGSSKSDIARCFAIRDHHFTAEHLVKLQEKFGSKNK